MDERFGPAWKEKDREFWPEFSRTYQVGKGVRERLLHDEKIRGKRIRARSWALWFLLDQGNLALELLPLFPGPYLDVQVSPGSRHEPGEYHVVGPGV